MLGTSDVAEMVKYLFHDYKNHQAIALRFGERYAWKDDCFRSVARTELALLKAGMRVSSSQP